MAFGLGFKRGLDKGLDVGVQSYQTTRKEKMDEETLTAKTLQTLKEKQASQWALYSLMGFQPKLDEGTGNIVPDPNVQPPAGFKRYEPTKEAGLISKLGTDERLAYNEYIKRIEEQPIGDYLNQREYYDPEKKIGIITGINKETGNREPIGENPFYEPKIKTKEVIEGVIDLEGRPVGKKGHRTRVMVDEAGNITTVDLGKIRSGSTENKPLSQLQFELDMADNEDTAMDIMNRRAKYLSGKFPTEEDRDLYRQGINSALNELALQVAKDGSEVAQKEILEIYGRGKNIIGQTAGALPPLTSTQFYEIESQKYIDMYQSGEIGYNDAQSILKFLEFKYKNHLEVMDSMRNQDEFQFDDFELGEEQ